MKVELLHHTPLWVAAGAIRTCWASGEKSDTLFTQKGAPYKVLPEDTHNGEVVQSEKGVRCEAGDKDKALIERVGNKFKHKSTLEHLDYNFKIEGISRAVLQELARHRTASLSVKSSRYTLKELKGEGSFVSDNPLRGWLVASSSQGYESWLDIDRSAKYLVLTGDDNVDACSIMALNNLLLRLQEGVSNDVAKYCMPEAYKTELTWTMDARNLQGFLALRTNKSALKEIRELAQAIFEVIPEEHKYLFEEFVYGSVAYDNAQLEELEALAKRLGYVLVNENE